MTRWDEQKLNKRIYRIVNKTGMPLSLLIQLEQFMNNNKNKKQKKTKLEWSYIIFLNRSSVESFFRKSSNSPCSKLQVAKIFFLIG
jgi:hypothetical protein